MTSRAGPPSLAGGIDNRAILANLRPIFAGTLGTTMTTIYGIKNCDTMKKARNWLDGQGIAYAFHDYKASGIDAATLKAWVGQLGWEKLLNRAGTTFRKLPDADREGLDESKAIALMVAQPSIIKRPVLVVGGKLFAGFSPEVYASAFGTA